MSMSQQQQLQSSAPNGARITRDLYEISTNIHAIDGELTAFYNQVRFPIRTTILTLPTGLLIISPLPLHLIASQIQNLGTPRYVLAPNGFHHIWAHEFVEAYEHVELYASDSLPKRFPGKDWGHVITPETSGDVFGETVKIKLIESVGWLREVVVLHRESESLIVTDLAFNFRREADELSLLMKVYVTLAGALGKANVSWPFVFIFAMGDIRGLVKELEEVLEWDWKRLIVTHGDIVENGGKSALRNGTLRFVKNIEAFLVVLDVKKVVAVALGAVVATCLWSYRYKA